jgi:glycosyltransferase involved in cell wall biosynthesis
MIHGECNQEYLQGCLETTQTLLGMGVDHSFNFIKNESLITRARNTHVANFLASDFEWLFFIDADIGFTPQHVIGLMDIEKGVACGCYRMKKPGSPYAAWNNGELKELDSFAEPFTVDYAGTGFMCIHRPVLETLCDFHPELMHMDGDPLQERYALFDTMLDDGVYLSEDYTFCKRWRDIGGEVWMHPDVRLVHVGSIEFK